MKIYVAGPYTGATRAEVQDNVNRAIDAGIELFRRGHQPYVPHLTDLVDIRARETGRGMSWEHFMAWDTPWLQASDALLLLAESRGALMELREAERMGKRIFLSMDDIPEADPTAPETDRPKINPDELLHGVTPENLHPEWGAETE